MTVQDQNYPTTTIFCDILQHTPKQSFGPGMRPHDNILYVSEGKGILQISNQIYHLQAGDTVLLSANEMFYLEADEYAPWTYAIAAFDGPVSDDLRKGCFRSSPVFPVCDLSVKIEAAFFRLVENFKKSRTLQLEVDGSLLDLLSLLAPAEKKRHKGTKEMYLKKAKAYIDENYCYDIRILDIARKLGIDRSYVYRLFIESEHMAPKEYLLNCRVLHARKMLDTGKYTPAEVSWSCGFPDPESLDYHFKRYYRMTSGEYLYQQR